MYVYYLLKYSYVETAEWCSSSEWCNVLVTFEMPRMDLVWGLCYRYCVV